jgi:hypothetical protein
MPKFEAGAAKVDKADCPAPLSQEILSPNLNYEPSHRGCWARKYTIVA